jgi:signal transduction histidine kinase
MKSFMELGRFGATEEHLAVTADIVEREMDTILAGWLPEAVDILRGQGWTSEDFSRAELEDEGRYALERLNWRFRGHLEAPQSDAERERFRLLGGLSDLDTERDARLVALFRVYSFFLHSVMVVTLDHTPEDWSGRVVAEIRNWIPRTLNLTTGFPTPCSFVDAVEDRLRQRQAETAEVFQQMLTAQEDERKRLSRDIHDVLAQTLATCHYRAETCALILDRDPDAAREDMMEVAGLISSTLDQVRDIIFDLRPSALDRGGLADAVEAYIDRMVGVERSVEFAVSEPVDTSDLDDSIKTTLYRIAQEAVSNVLRHSGATSARVQIVRDHDRVELTVIDAGHGFDTANAADAEAEGHIGLASMRERCELLGGSFSIDSEPGRGTQVRAAIPLSPPLKTHA